MIPFNPGNLLAFQRDTRAFLRHKQDGQDVTPFGIKAASTRLIPFQLFIPAGAGVVTWELINPINPTGGTGTTMTAGDLEVDQKAGGGFWVSWRASGNLTTQPACGFWEIWLTIDGALYYSEVIQVFAAGFAISDWRFRFDNENVDKGNVLNQIGYRQYFYPTRWAWDRPGTERDVEDTVDGNGNTTTTFSRTVAKFRLEVADIPDYCLPFFAKCGDNSFVTFSDGTENDLVRMVNTEFESRPQGKGLNIGIFTFDSEVESFNGCQENFLLV